MQPTPNRRDILSAATLTAALAAAPASGQSPASPMLMAGKAWDVIIVGAGVFGAWTAWYLLQAGKRVLLLDAYGPAHARGSSGGESRMTRTAYGADEAYTRMAWDSLADWRELSRYAGLPIFHETGVLFFFGKQEAYVTETVAVHQRLKLPTQLLDATDLRRRFPQIDFTGVSLGLYEPTLGALMARRSVQTLVDRFVQAGGTYKQTLVLPPVMGKRLTGLVTPDGRTLSAGQYVFACGPWLPKLFPALLGSRIFPTRQEIFFFAPPDGDTRFAPGALPGWADFNDGDIYYGFPDLEARGFKIAHDKHGPPIDPDSGDRVASEGGLANVRAYMARRFPYLGDSPLVETRVCQYENSANGDLLIDRHPDDDRVLLVGAGSGHGFKHGPAVGRLATSLALDGKMPAARFSLASKATVQNRAVH